MRNNGAGKTLEAENGDISHEISDVDIHKGFPLLMDSLQGSRPPIAGIGGVDLVRIPPRKELKKQSTIQPKKSLRPSIRSHSKQMKISGFS
jgi:hypothetical protein